MSDSTVIDEPATAGLEPAPLDAEDDDGHAGPPTWLLPLLSAIVALGVVVAFFVAFALSFSGIQEHRNQAQLYGTLRGLLDPSSPTAPYLGGRIPVGAPVALLTAPAAGIHDVVVVEGTTSEQMRDGPGHLRNSPLPGQVGDAILIGRSTTTGAPFGSIDHLRRGDPLTITTGQGHFRFTVEDVRRAGSHLPAIPPSGSIVTLITSSGSGFLGGVVNGHLLYVDAALRGTAAAAPEHAPHQITAAEVQGHGDPAALPWVLAWFVGLVAVAVGGYWLIARWGWRRAWLIVAPVGIAVLWGFSDELLQLVPNVF